MLDFVIAKTHTPEYLIHKYWARKPHNILMEIIRNIQGNNNLVVLDPFCGSGVFLREASKLGNTAFGFDVNPVAAVLSDVTCNPPSPENFIKVVEPILTEFENLCNRAYSLIQGAPIRYIVHNSVVMCEHCNTFVSSQSAKKEGRIYKCPKCNDRLHFNLKNLRSTEIRSIVTINGIISSDNEIKKQKTLSDKQMLPDLRKYDIEFPENKRTLTYKGMKTSDLFTPRNFSLLCWLADQFHKIEDRKIREAALLLLTASSAQCSRLIAYRNNMSTGGPAWSVPGFWVPPVHLETNPYHHLNARFKKFYKGLKELKSSSTSHVKVFNDDARNINKYDLPNVDLVFLDPPYGDSIPYVEFSMMWNSFLKIPINAEQDISVSDRDSRKSDSWIYYEKSLKEIISRISNLLNENGKILITFNNHDHKAWSALIGAIQDNGFSCTSTMYQVPAVVSAKSQFSPEGSYVSDIYAIFERCASDCFSYSFETVIKKLRLCAYSREHGLTKSLVYRTAFLSIIENNVHHSLFSDIDDIVNEIFEISDGYYFAKEEDLYDDRPPSIRDICIEKLRSLTLHGSCEWSGLYHKIAKASVEIGIPDPGEVREILKEYIIIKGKKCIPVKEIINNKLQQSLF